VLRSVLDRATTTAQATAAVARSGLLAPARPSVLARGAIAVQRRGPIAGAAIAAGVRWGDRSALADELGTLTYTEIDRRSNAVANAWRSAGIRPGDGVAILCRNHRGFLDATYAGAKLGLRSVYMNTEFAGPQIRDVCERERVSVLVFDEEFDDRAPDFATHHFRAWTDAGDAGNADATLEELIAAGDPSPVPVPPELPTTVMLTSGTTGTPKGAPRQEVGPITALGALLDRVPFRTKECTYVAPPMFHSLGFATLTLALSLGSMVVARRRFAPEEFLGGIAEHRATAAVVVPAMLQRTLELGHERIGEFDTSSLRIVFCGGAQLPGAVATEVLDVFGDVLYVLYGSTEVAYVSITTPADHRAAPASVGRPALGANVRLLDDRGRDVPEGQTGRIFVSNGVEFEGYTDGRTKQVIDGVMSSGDVGHFDADGRLYVDGRDDDMIVSGGENVFPQEVEELLIAHERVTDAAVIGVPDEDFGARLCAFVVAADEPPDEAELKAYVKRNLARYKVPRDVRFVDELPRNATGKVLKRELVKQVA
jgi:fatty-acyl-CoA synthase